MIYNNQKKYTSALLTLNASSIKNWIQKEHIQSSEEVLKKIKSEMLLFADQPEFKGKFPSKWIPSQFQIVEEEFSEANKMINSTLKMVRKNITEVYQNRLDIMYEKNAQKKALEENVNCILKNYLRFNIC